MNSSGLALYLFKIIPWRKLQQEYKLFGKGRAEIVTKLQKDMQDLD